MDFRIQKGDIPGLMRMYQTVFGETDRTTDLFFSDMVTIENTFATFVADRLVSMAFGVARNFKFYDETKKAIYICGVATQESERGKGHQKAIINFMIDKYKAEGIDFLYLVPANEGLFSMYEKHGFFTAFYLNRQEAQILESEIAEPIKTETKDLLFCYNNMKKNFDIFQLRQKTDFEFLLKDFSQVGGCLSYGERGYILYYIIDKIAHIRETTIEDTKLLGGSLFYFKKQFGAQRAIITTPMRNNKQDKPYAMVLPLNCERQAFSNDFGKNFANLNYD